MIGKKIHTFEQVQQALAHDVAAIDAGPRPTMSTHKAGICLLHFEPNPVLATDHEVAIEREPILSVSVGEAPQA